MSLNSQAGSDGHSSVGKTNLTLDVSGLESALSKLSSNPSSAEHDATKAPVPATVTSPVAAKSSFESSKADTSAPADVAPSLSASATNADVLASATRNSARGNVTLSVVDSDNHSAHYSNPFIESSSLGPLGQKLKSNTDRILFDLEGLRAQRIHAEQTFQVSARTLDHLPEPARSSCVQTLGPLSERINKLNLEIASLEAILEEETQGGGGDHGVPAAANIGGGGDVSFSPASSECKVEVEVEPVVVEDAKKVEVETVAGSDEISFNTGYSDYVAEYNVDSGPPVEEAATAPDLLTSATSTPAAAGKTPLRLGFVGNGGEFQSQTYPDHLFGNPVPGGTPSSLAGGGGGLGSLVGTPIPASGPAVSNGSGTVFGHSVPPQSPFGGGASPTGSSSAMITWQNTPQSHSVSDLHCGVRVQRENLPHFVSTKNISGAKNREHIVAAPKKTLGAHPHLLPTKDAEEEDKANLTYFSTVVSDGFDIIEEIRTRLVMYSLFQIFWIPFFSCNVESLTHLTDVDFIQLHPGRVVSQVSQQRNFLEQWASVSWFEVCFWQKLFNLSRYFDPIDRVASNLAFEFLQNCVSSGLQIILRDKFESLSRAERGPLTFWFVVTEKVFPFSRDTSGPLHRFFQVTLPKRGLDLWQQSVPKARKVIYAVIKFLFMHDELKEECIKEILMGFAKARNADFQTFAQRCLDEWNAGSVFRMRSKLSGAQIQATIHHFLDGFLNFFTKQVAEGTYPEIKVATDKRISLASGGGVGGSSGKSITDICWHCEKTGHHSSACPTPNPANKQKNYELYCKEKGITPKSNRNGGGKGGKSDDDRPKRDYGGQIRTGTVDGATRAMMFCNKCSAFVHDHSTGTHDLREKAVKAGKAFFLGDHKPGNPLVALNQLTRAAGSGSSSSDDAASTAASGVPLSDTARAQFTATAREVITTCPDAKTADAIKSMAKLAGVDFA